ncbi:MAG: VCBS repeat-containing protein [Akkermansiaceae bacterium]|jgi:hypothetical protein|nr:VCBS repeat-containing protein [Akkermansiaceae bacterium]
MKIRAIVFPLILLGVLGAVAQIPKERKWRKQVVTKDFITEGLSAGDLDGDGAKDLVAGAFWFKGPDFRQAQPYRPGRPSPIDAYMEDSFLSWVDDLDGDGDQDILMAGHPGREVMIYQNPGGDASGEWLGHKVMTEAATESPLWLDLDGSKPKELVCMQGGRFGYAIHDPANVTQAWTFVPISAVRTTTPYVHGLGVGDLSGDGRPDIVEKDGWFEQPEKLPGEWKWHAHPFAGKGGAQMLVFDADSDGDQDMITSLDGHGYGLVWYENHRSSEGGVSFHRHEILPEDPAKTGVGGLQFSQLHALEAGDFDKDGRMDFITGKRFWAHNGRDPGARDPALAVLFLNRKKDSGIDWQPQVLDDDSGVGCQVLAVDLDNDGHLEFAAGSKKGVHVIRR